uniref:RING-type E3 ubiquitin transferase n=1 Tax=Timema shepardi TaxID=629360 RepID=A0A7R9ARH5_TIMSH|nr:unnamed protein product [Timema shepardi]
MGALTSRQNAGVEEVDIVSNHAYKYPPRSGNYFGSHFIMGGERFDTPQPEAYLFGENADLNFLGSRPTPFPYPPPQANEPTKTLKSLVNIRKESLRFVRSPEGLSKAGADGDCDYLKATNFNIEFTFDCDARCAITIYYFSTEEISTTGITYNPRDPSMSSETYHYKRGANQQFCQVSHVFNPAKYLEDELNYDPERDMIPITIHCVTEEGTEVRPRHYSYHSLSTVSRRRGQKVTVTDTSVKYYPERDMIPITIHCVTEEGTEELRQSHTTIAVVDRHLDGTYVLKALKQKLYVDGLCYLLQEIYGIENKNNEIIKGGGDEDMEDNGSECVICMCDVRDTLILPCRHLCLCNSCADSLRYQANNCPICRAPFRALLQIRALQKCVTLPQGVALPTEGNDNVPVGYEGVSLIEALNGPCPTRPVPLMVTLDVAETPDQDVASQAVEALNRSHLERTSSSKLRLATSPEDPELSRDSSTPEFRMSVLLAQEEEGHKDGQPSNKSPLLLKHCNAARDLVKLINEKTHHDSEQTVDEDSESEKLSPLLDAATSANPLAVDCAVPTSADELDLDEDDMELKVEMLPEDKRIVTMTNERISSVESTPGRWMGVSLPGTPLSTPSHLSTRSSGDSYSSSSSTRQLLATVGCATADKALPI